MTQPTKEPAKWMRLCAHDFTAHYVAERPTAMQQAEALAGYIASHAPASVDGEVVGLLEEVPLALHPADERGPCLCSQCNLRRRIRTTLAKLRGQAT